MRGRLSEEEEGWRVCACLKEWNQKRQRKRGRSRRSGEKASVSSRKLSSGQSSGEYGVVCNFVIFGGEKGRGGSRRSKERAPSRGAEKVKGHPAEGLPAERCPAEGGPVGVHCHLHCWKGPFCYFLQMKSW